MRYAGRITEWNDERGFGFVVPNGGGERAFVHIKAYEQRSARPAVGTLISYVAARDAKGRLSATAIRVVNLKPGKPTAVGRGFPITVIAVIFIALLVLAWLVGRIPLIVVAVYSAMSVFAALLYAIDKSAAQNNRWRIQESTLHAVALAGGWPGALIAQQRLRHKSKKQEFLFVFWTTVVINIAVLLWLLSSGKAADINRSLLGVLIGG